MIFQQTYMTKCHSLFTLISMPLDFFALMFINIWFTHVRWLFVLLLFLAESYETINHFKEFTEAEARSGYGYMLQPLGWRCIECAIHYERDVY